VADHEIALEPPACADLAFGERDEMVDDAPVAIVPAQPVGSGGQVAAVEQHPDEAVRFEIVGQRLRGLQELVAVVEPRRFDKAAHAEDDSGLP